MELGIAGRTALLCGSSQGLGYACAEMLVREGVNVIINGRVPDKLEAAAERLRALGGGTVRTIAADQTTVEGRKAIIEQAGDIDILVNNNAGPPPGVLADWDEEAILSAVNANMIPAVQFIRAFVPGMRARKFGRIVNITSAMVKSPFYVMGLSTSARSALTAMSKAISKDVVIDNVTINNLLPERIDTPRQEFMARRIMAEQGVDWDEARRQITDTIAAKRFGRPEEFASACAFFCSANAGFISGQNLQVDGGSYEGVV
ncbi:SDR family oxidoreductase [Croceicoccus bisphenolivorans]|uniref:SDR family oxidoreductase n=1 Tax=Croceicoccus bisphenolivorans TaxID=1783232 RepID=UPI00082F3EF8|nr:SDR family oxidoreductase [Croceicoccus bisphenolivorans]